MALKPIFEKAPLMTPVSLPLRPGQARTDGSPLQTLYALAKNAERQPCCWEGLFRLACVLTAHPLEEPVTGWILSAVSAQGEDGSLPGSVGEQVALLRAAYAIYEVEPKRSLLEKLVLWCGWACEHWEAVLADAAVRVSPADLMSLMQALYRITGKKALLFLCDRLRAGAMDWSGVLHTFAMQQPMKRTLPWNELEKGMARENGDESGFYTRQYLTCHGETLADGLRAAAVSAAFSGSGTELSAPKTGWEKISRYHGAVCGGVTADETLGGSSPSFAVGAASLGAWAEGLAEVREDWAWDALDILLHNALPACLTNGHLNAFQRVNGLAENSGAEDCYHTAADAEERALQRLCRGYAAILIHAVTLRQDGLSVNLYLPGRFSVPTPQGTLALQVSGSGGQWAVAIRTKQPIQTVIRLRIPSWGDDASVTLNGMPIGERADTSLVLDRMWQNGDLISLVFHRKLRVQEGYHQSACVYWGNELMVYPVQADGVWNVALCGEPILSENGTVTVPLRRVPQWKRKGDVPADLPVLPQTEGDAFTATLTPYAATPCRISLFPRGRQA